jgi:streptogramin lyase
MVSGVVLDVRGRSVPGAIVSGRDDASRVTVSVRAAADGRFLLPVQNWQLTTITARAPGYVTRSANATATPVVIRLTGGSAPLTELSSARFLNVMKMDTDKRRFILDCTGCHVLNERITHVNGRPRTRDEWLAVTKRMMERYGQQSEYPVIGPWRNADSTADYMMKALSQLESSASRGVRPELATGDAARAVITEYDLPDSREVPQDLAVDPTGRVVLAGTGSMWVLDPSTGKFSAQAIPRPNASPRALEIERDGTWWLMLGAQNQIAKRDASSRWSFFDVGVGGNSLARDGGGLWFNGEFTKNPERIGRLDPNGTVQMYDVPQDTAMHNATGLPYELKRANDGTIWMSELAGNRVLSLNPSTGSWRPYELPMPYGGPRRLDVGADGSVWVPIYAYGALAKLDPRTGRVMHYALPEDDALPSVAKVDRRTGLVWVASGAADMLFRFNPKWNSWTEFPLPTRGAQVNQLDLDPRNGDVWVTYAASPGGPAKVARLRLAAAG